MITEPIQFTEIKPQLFAQYNDELRNEEIAPQMNASTEKSVSIQHSDTLRDPAVDNEGKASIDHGYQEKSVVEDNQKHKEGPYTLRKTSKHNLQ
jgi:hypothetical protein